MLTLNRNRHDRYGSCCRAPNICKTKRDRSISEGTLQTKVLQTYFFFFYSCLNLVHKKKKGTNFTIKQSRNVALHVNCTLLSRRESRTWFTYNKIYDDLRPVSFLKFPPTSRITPRMWIYKSSLFRNTVIYLIWTYTYIPTYTYIYLFKILKRRWSRKKKNREEERALPMNGSRRVIYSSSRIPVDLSGATPSRDRI